MKLEINVQQTTYPILLVNNWADKALMQVVTNIRDLSSNLLDVKFNTSFVGSSFWVNYTATEIVLIPSA